MSTNIPYQFNVKEDNIKVEKIRTAENGFMKTMGDIPPSVSIPIIASIAIILSIITVYLAKCVIKKKRKEAQLESMMPKSPVAQLYAGVRADQPIEFVVPTITLNETYASFTTEDSLSDSDFLSGHTYGSDREVKRRKSSFGRHSINANEISVGLYDEDNNGQLLANVTFVVHYSFHRQQLLFTLLSAKNLPQRRNKLSSFAKIILLPEKTPKFVTKVQRNNNNPSFNELFVFPAPRGSLDQRILRITLWNSDSFSRKSFIGQCLYPLKNAGIHSAINNDVISEDLSCKLSTNHHELLLSLTFKPDASTLTLSVVKARNICIKGIQTVYVKVALYLKKKRIRSRKSPVRRAQQEIEFDDTFHVHVASHALDDIIIGVTVYGRSTSIGSKQLLGRTYVGEYSVSEQGKTHWDDMKEHINSTVNQWHKLY